MCQGLTIMSEVSNTKDEQIAKLRSQISAMSDMIKTMEAEQRIPKNMDFVQVTRSELRGIGELGEKNPLALKLLMMFAQTMNKQNAVMMSYQTMELLTKRSRSSLNRALSILKKDKWVEVIKIGTANAYVLNQAIFWTDRGDRKKMASFSAQIITTLEEQEKDLRNNPNIKLKRVPMVANHERLILNSEDLPPPDQKDLELS